MSIMKDKVKILFPAFRIVVCLVALVFTVVFVDVSEWNWRIWCLAFFLLLILVWSAWDVVVLLKRIKR
ncbi:hypothetical protein DWW23_14340 [Parabacteroides sp. AF14-59]|nr:hypothetical protein DWW23_14340 [Parabacteroides sp. AF14-59]